VDVQRGSKLDHPFLVIENGVDKVEVLTHVARAHLIMRMRLSGEIYEAT
jgi:hypothetical protein